MENNKINVIEQAQTLDRSVPPGSGKPRDVNFPKFFETRSDNGITVLVIEDKRLPLITSRFVFKSGSYMDYFAGENKYGLASMTSELLTKGTSGRSATKIAEETDFLGATISSGCDYDATYVSSYSLKKYFDNIFEIVTDVILDPKFEEEEISRLREQRLNSLLSMTDDGDYLSEKVFKKSVYENNPYAFPVEGNKASIKNLNREDITEFYRRIFNPENLIVAFVGDITPEEAMNKINEKFSGWKNNPELETKPLIPAHKEKTKVYLTEKKGAVQSSIKTGHIGISRGNPDFIPVNVMNTMLGGYFTSRINKNLREVNGYTYGARSVFYSNKFSGDFSVMTEVKNNITADTVKEILKEINDIRNDLVSEDELQNVKNYISGSFPLQLETPNAIASKVINLKLYDLEEDYYNTYIQRVNRLSMGEIRDAAVKYLHPEKLVISIAGNVKEIEDDMKVFGEVEIVKDIF
ncbi:MAG: insulinase family protein [Ignavibacteria bacterium]|nr:insulinase family protein [Ignavibacteria bacterium]